MAGSVPVPACKEWAVVVDALLRGEQILDLRKGGIREEGRRFELRGDRFWLFPTYEHQDAALLKPAHRQALKRVLVERGRAAADHVRIDGWAEVAGTALLTEPEPLEALDREFIWTGEYAAERLRWKRRQPLWLLALRVHRVDEPLIVPMVPDYAGCSSWVTLRGVVEDPATLPGEPAVEASEFASRFRAVTETIPGGLGSAEAPGGPTPVVTLDGLATAAATPRSDSDARGGTNG